MSLYAQGSDQEGTMAENREPKARRTIRVADHTAESLLEIASHSPSYAVEGLHDQAATAAASKDQTKVTIGEDSKKKADKLISQKLMSPGK
jgi:predicted nucleic acid-binding protein